MAPAHATHDDGDAGLSAIETAALRVRVDELSKDVHGLHSDLRDSHSALNIKLEALTSKLDATRTPNWQMWGVMVTCMIALGALAYWPVREATTDLKGLGLRLGEIVLEDRVKIGVLEERSHNLDRRLDAISNRLAELIRTGK
jgi:hypothetical protein